MQELIILQFGYVYDRVACNPRLQPFHMGYSIKIFTKIAPEASRGGAIRGGKEEDNRNTLESW